MKKVDLSHLATTWKSSVVARSQAGEFSGGLVAPGTLANADSRGDGPEGRFRVGRNTGYPVKSLIRWLEQRAS